MNSRMPTSSSSAIPTQVGHVLRPSWGCRACVHGDRPDTPYLIVYFRHPDFVDVVDVPHTRTNYLAALINYLGSP